MKISDADLKTKWAGLAHLGLPEPKAYSDLFQAPYKIVPGIPSIEVLPPALQNDPSYFFAGPLVMDDYLVGNIRRKRRSLSDSKNFDSLQEFFAKHSDRNEST